MQKDSNNNSSILDVLVLLTVLSISGYLIFSGKESKVIVSNSAIVMKVKDDFKNQCFQEMKALADRNFAQIAKVEKGAENRVSVNFASAYCGCLMNKLKAQKIFDRNYHEGQDLRVKINGYLNSKEASAELKECSEVSKEKIGIKGSPESKFVSACTFETFNGLMKKVTSSGRTFTKDGENRMRAYSNTYCRCVLQKIGKDTDLNKDSMEKLVELYKTKKGQQTAQQCANDAKKQHL